jgi:hypothetical protein
MVYSSVIVTDQVITSVFRCDITILRYIGGLLYIYRLVKAQMIPVRHQDLFTRVSQPYNETLVPRPASRTVSYRYGKAKKWKFVIWGRGPE